MQIKGIQNMWDDQQGIKLFKSWVLTNWWKSITSTKLSCGGYELKQCIAYHIK